MIRNATVVALTILLTACGGGGTSAPSTPQRQNSVPTAAAVPETTVDESYPGPLVKIQASDPDNDPLSFAVAAGQDGAAFAIDQDGTLRAPGGLDFEKPSDANHDNRYELSVRVSDGRAETMVPVTIIVRDRGAKDVPAAIPYPDSTPTAEAPVAALRLPGDRWLIRVASVLGGAGPGDFDEWVLRNPRGLSGVNDGWHMVAHSAWIGGRQHVFMREETNLGRSSTVEFAWRLGSIDKPYVSGGAGPDYDYAGFGHGHMVTVDNAPSGPNRIVSSENTADLRGAGDYVGVWAKSLTFDYHFTMRTPQDRDAASMHFVQQFNVDGLTMTQEVETIGAGIGVNDTYVMMYPMTASDTVKPFNLSEYLAHDDGSVSRLWLHDDISAVQIFDHRDRTVMALLTTLGGQPLRRPDKSLPAYAYNDDLRSFVADNLDFPKFYIAGFSTAEDHLVARPLSGSYVAQSNLRTRYSAAGPL
jgi:hypothetical protein